VHIQQISLKTVYQHHKISTKLRVSANEE
jgi:hypothetical protein